MSNPAGACEVARSLGEIESRLPFFAENVHRINDIAYGLESVCDRIAGPTPANVTDSPKEPRPESVIDQLDKSNADTQTAMGRLQSAANRLRELI